jgi:hypothetical protein
MNRTLPAALCVCLLVRVGFAEKSPHDLRNFQFLNANSNIDSDKVSYFATGLMIVNTDLIAMDEANPGGVIAGGIALVGPCRLVKETTRGDQRLHVPAYRQRTWGWIGTCCKGSPHRITRAGSRATWLLRWKHRLALWTLKRAPAVSTMPGQSVGLDQSQAVENSFTAETFLNQKLFMWQRRLQLEGWHIDLKIVHLSELKPKTLGHIQWYSDARRANISVLHPADYRLAFADALKDMEFTVVHELVHLQLVSLGKTELSRFAEERAVNSLTKALLTLHWDP